MQDSVKLIIRGLSVASVSQHKHRQQLWVLNSKVVIALVVNGSPGLNDYYLLTATGEAELGIHSLPVCSAEFASDRLARPTRPAVLSSQMSSATCHAVGGMSGSGSGGSGSHRPLLEV
ncbi:uncharacterized protein LOC124365137 [Homalodisca vitripennis]|uniref:uncharacterized protein LOC124365137 n=1 Tax=Homalodisca vitripennis TaxID=197043 RepID=UPI001EEBB68B|nr:uncharacterized protein LOC124365137 [Homalodisca vitripennis]